MRRFALAAVLAAVALLGLGTTADAQVVIGTRPAYAPGTVVSPGGIIGPGLTTGGAIPMTGYYSPYPGYLYSPFANQPAFNNFYNPYGYGMGGFGYGNYYGGFNTFGGFNNGFNRGVRYSTYPSGGTLHASPNFHYYHGRRY